MGKAHLKNLAITAIFLAMGILLPLLTGQVPQIGSMLLPMHIPVFLCAFLCGWRYGSVMAAVLPLLRTALFGRPTLYPEAIAIAFELACYALVAGFLYDRCRKKSLLSIYVCMLCAMVAGRAVRGLVQLSLLQMRGLPFTGEAFWVGIIAVSLPGIALQLFFIPTAVKLAERHLRATDARAFKS